MFSNSALEELIGDLEKVKQLKKFNQFAFFNPYPKQLQFIALGGKYRERALFANNQGGKTITVCGEVAAHVTGKYPAWWPKTAKRFSGPVEFIVAGKTGISTRDILQKKLLGSAGSASNLGTGMIPKSDIVVESKIASHGAGGGIDYIEIRHLSGDLSRLFFRTYAQGPDLFQGVTLTGGIIFDEEPTEEVYDEGFMRIAATDGFMALSFSPQAGRTPIVKRFLDQRSNDRAFVNMSIFDSEHLSKERKEQIITKVREHEPHMYLPRIMGMPNLGENAVFPVDFENVKMDYPKLSEMPPELYYLWAIDPGIGHPFAAVLIGWERDTDCIHLIRALRIKGQTPMQHAFAMKQIAPAVPVAWPKDAGNREKSTGFALKESYAEHGLNMLTDHVTNSDGGVGLEPGLLEINERITTGRFKVNRALKEWFDEARDYHRDESGNVVAVEDDLMSASRYAIMAKMKGKQGSPDWGPARPKRAGGGRTAYAQGYSAKDELPFGY